MHSEHEDELEHARQLLGQAEHCFNKLPYVPEGQLETQDA